MNSRDSHLTTRPGDIVLVVSIYLIFGALAAAVCVCWP
jgi:hypothetical protein